ncbi:DUF255 domain-containing protein [Mucilaginibacter pocheonensis]|uniref:Thiol-disulfide isomerase/thioredoxin n=1 Tax=Mucilaginibacter pocheonensis TaxID=398050 RepID=A0ABU1T818_9SPHI|nr:thioredoxin family protein [Mucilaginibacter pocheonensis]MDR6941360.1 thiol-disulfide isomerase/thioredoxin [Mucilaginibacter pocheonensis]
MKKIIVFLILCLSTTLLRAQDQGIRFQTGLSWAQIRAKAKAQNKYIFVDCYATWCGPCKWMAANIYPQKGVGNYFNSHFINVAVQMDKTAKDANDIKRFYADAEMLSKNYEVGEYPTYLFFSPEGKIVHRFAETTPNGEDFINKAKDAFDPEKQFYTLVKRCEEHKTDSAYLKAALKTATDADNQESTEVIAGYYFKTLKNLFVKSNIQDISGTLGFLGPDHFQFGYTFFLDNAAKVDAIITNQQKYYAESQIARIIFDKEQGPLFNDPKATIYWSKVEKDVLSAHPDIALGLTHWEKNWFNQYQISYIKTDLYKVDPNAKGIFEEKLDAYYKKFPDTHENVKKVVFEGRYKLFAKNQQWQAANQAAYAYLHECGKDLSSGQINSVCWDIIFPHSSDPQILAEAAIYMKTAVGQSPEDESLWDTYANVLYKAGHVSASIETEKKAISLADANSLNQGSINDSGMKRLHLKNKKEFEETLAKMQNNTPTWPTADVATNH